MEASFLRDCLSRRWRPALVDDQTRLQLLKLELDLAESSGSLINGNSRGIFQPIRLDPPTKLQFLPVFTHRRIVMQLRD